MCLLSACGVYSTFRTNVQQGNVINDKQIAKIKPGMQKKQVAFILGSPVLSNTFTPNRWEYVHTSQVRSRKLSSTKLILQFKKDKLVSIQGPSHN